MTDASVSFPVGVGDVVQRASEERWVRSGLVFVEAGEPALALLFADGPAREAIAVFAPPVRAIGWLTAQPVALPPSPPFQLEAGGALYTRERALAAEVLPAADPPVIGATAVVAVYHGPGGELGIAVAGAAGSLFLAGDRLEPGDYDVLGRAE